jgi:integrase
LKLANSFPLVGAVNAITLGHRVYMTPDGTERVCRPWFAVWYEQGQQRARSLKTTNKQAAIKQAMQIDAQLSAGIGVAPRSITIEELVRAFVGAKEGERRAPKTISKYAQVLTEFVSCLPADVCANATRLTADHFWAYSRLLTKRKNSENTWHDKLTIVKTFGRWAAQNRKLASHPFATCKVPEPPSTQQPCFAPEQVAALIQSATGQLRSIVIILVYTGIRFGELRDLEWTHVDLRVPAVTIEKGGSGNTTKGRRSRIIPLHPEAAETLRTIPRRGPRVFYQELSATYPLGDNPLDERRLLRSFKRLCARAGLANAEHYNLHTCRHTFASMLAPHVSERYGLQLMGHQESAVLRRYVTLFDSELTRAVGKINIPRLTLDGNAGNVVDSTDGRPAA